MTAGRHIRGNSRDWGTPEFYVDAVRKALGRIDLDPCSSRHSVVNAAVEYAPPRDGLRESWDYATVYVNPPYGIADGKYKSGIGDWLARCAHAHELHGSEVIALVPVATNTSHWKTSVFGRAAAVCFLYDTRLKFLVNGKQGGERRADVLRDGLLGASVQAVFRRIHQVRGRDRHALSKGPPDRFVPHVPQIRARQRPARRAGQERAGGDAA